ncbi:MAG: S8 family serine peptidase [Pseudobdellovibrio sp.]
MSSNIALAQLSTPQAVSGEYIVKYKVRDSVSTNLRIRKMNKGVSVKSAFSGSEMMHVKVSNAAARDSLYSDPDIEFVEPNYILSVNPIDVSALGSAPDSSDDYNQSNSNVKVKESWDIEKPYNEGTKAIVAVIDTGLDRNHLIFKDSGAIWENTSEKNGVSGVDDDGNGYVDDINGWNYVSNSSNMFDDNKHGTHVSGIVLGVGQDITAYPVRESKVIIMALKFLDSTGSGSTANAVSAIYYAVAKGAKVINNSWGGPSYSQSLHEAYTYAYNHGVVIVSAAGNSNINNDVTAMYPTNLDSPNNISVLASTDTDQKASFSNYGATTVHVAAPGSKILSSVPGTGCLAPGCFQMMSGTSMATPFVAGLAALVSREAPQLSAYQIKSIVLGSIDTISTFSGKVTTGGRVNAYKSIVSAKAQVATSAWSPSYSPDYKAGRSTASEAEEAGAVGGCGLVKAAFDASSSGGNGSGAAASDLMLILVMVMLPLVVALNLRAKVSETARAQNRRTYDRFAVAQNAVLDVYGQTINITTEDMSLGGVSFKSNTQLQKGQVVRVSLGENSQEKIAAEVVWCSNQQSYGLRFLNVSDNIKYQIKLWTTGLVPST